MQIGDQKSQCLNAKPVNCSTARSDSIRYRQSPELISLNYCSSNVLRLRFNRKSPIAGVVYHLIIVDSTALIRFNRKSEIATAMRSSISTLQSSDAIPIGNRQSAIAMHFHLWNLHISDPIGEGSHLIKLCFMRSIIYMPWTFGSFVFGINNMKLIIKRSFCIYLCFDLCLYDALHIYVR